MTTKCKYLMWLYFRRIRNRPLLSVLILLIVVYIIAAFIVMQYENIGFGPACLRIFPSFFGELGVIESPRIAVQISTVVGILVSVTFVVIITARVTSSLVESLRRGGSMAKRVNFDGHTIVCGWNFQGKRLVSELLASNVKQYKGIVVIHDSDQRPEMDERVEFIQGDPSQRGILESANTYKADSVIVLTNYDKQMNDADAEVLMIVLAIESMNRNIHTCAQVRNSANRPHLERAHADEIICLDQMGASIAVASALNHGISRVLNELLTFNMGSEFYRYDSPLSDALVDKRFTEAVAILAERHIILIGIDTSCSDDIRQNMACDVLNLSPECDKAIIVNPISDYRLRQGDALFIIAESMPTYL